MFTAGRILRRREGVATIAGDLVSEAAGRERRKFRCYVPFVRHSALATLAGFVVMATGVGFCIAGFYMVHQNQHHHQQQEQHPQPQNESDNNTEVFTVDSSYSSYILISTFFAC